MDLRPLFINKTAKIANFAHFFPKNQLLNRLLAKTSIFDLGLGKHYTSH